MVHTKNEVWGYIMLSAWAMLPKQKISEGSTEVIYFFCRYNPENLTTLERYIQMQAEENVYDLEANLAVLKL